MALAYSEDFAAPRRPGAGTLLLDALPGLILAVLLLAGFLLLVYPRVLRGELLDPDSYMHVVRLRALLADGSWHGGFVARDNAPYGMVLHWSKAYDLVFLALAAPIAAFSGWQTALAATAAALGPLSLLALIIVGVWAVRPLLGVAERRLLGMMLALEPLAVNYGMAGNATYHLPIVVAWLVFLGLAVRMVTMPGGPGQGIGAGLAAAFALWLTVECILVVLLGITLVVFAWVRAGACLRSASLGLVASLSLALSLLLAWDPPYAGWLYPELERLSIVYVVFALLLALVFSALALAPQGASAWRARLAVALVGAALAASALLLLFPQLLSPVRAVFGEELIAQFWSKIQEGKPAFVTMSRGITLIGGPALGLVAALAFASRERQRERRLGWLWLALMLLLLSVPGLLHTSFAIHAETLSALPLAVLAARLGAVADRRIPLLPLRVLARALVATLLLIGPPLLGGVVALAEAKPQPPPPACGVRTVAAALDDPAFMGGSDLIIMTPPDQAPEVLYWTSNRVVAGAYHLNVEGMHDVYAFMTGREERSSYAILARRGIAYVMICPWPIAAGSIKPSEATLEERLTLGTPPAWLAPVAWPPGTESDLKLFRVVASAAPR